ncbi:MAG: cyclase family protein [Ignavibacteria bacterium]
MKFSFEIEGKSYEIDSAKSIDISIPLDFYGDQPNAYGIEKAAAETYRSDKFVGDTRKGGSCNFEKYSFIPHCNGTHTECVGHISFERIFINGILKDSLVPCSLFTVEPVPADKTNEKYIPAVNPDDYFITRSGIEKAVLNSDRNFLKGLIIRTKPNEVSKKSRDYMKVPPPFLSRDAIEFIVSLGVNHLLVDIPSIDRALDEGKLTNHHIYWNIPEGSHEVNASDISRKTITEMIYAEDSIKDGCYLLDLQIASFKADASPSRPVLYKIK